MTVFDLYLTGNSVTPLLVAATANQPHVACGLIRLGAHVNAADNKGQTALYLAATYGYQEVILMYDTSNCELGKKQRIQISTESTTALDVKGFDFEALCPPAAILNPMQAHGNTALHMTAGLNVDDGHQEAIIRLLLANGADLSLLNYYDKDQPIHLLPPGPQICSLQIALNLSTSQNSPPFSANSKLSTPSHTTQKVKAKSPLQL
ncbi:NF-kappa-B inhibitor delta-like [Scleropages formosus]|uniref:NF-kappa-B inhibitor delta-like n=1 Tax=Scleropages formosus TaxID=113540 RepID=UPI0010FA8FDD|nr:NF-kappa-B inhibitor delta-like [Scleropages formosus]